MKPLNLFLLTRVSELDEFLSLHRYLSQLKYKINQQIHEFISLKGFVDNSFNLGLNISDYDGFYYSYRIPQIGKEFDLLKFSDNKCLNIELKIEMTSEDKIKDQLLKNKYYLNALNKEIILFSYVNSDQKCYTIDEYDNLNPCNLEDIVDAIRLFSFGEEVSIDSLFRVRNYLVSPINTPEAFLKGNYFLTSQQAEIKNNIVDGIAKRPFHRFISIKGSPGTGKTLLVYDVARELSQDNNVLLVHCGIKSEGHKIINESISNIKIVIPKEINSDFSLDEYDIIIVDEVQRIYNKQYDLIVDSVVNSGQVCIFSSDKYQILSRAESRRKIWERISNIPELEEYTLSEKIRTNMEMAAFIRKVRNLNISEVFDSQNIEVVYADCKNEAKNILEYYVNREYTFINFSQSNYNYSPYSEYDYLFDTHHVIGQEFDNVVMILDQSFFYDTKNILSAYSHPNPDYLYTQLFYQGITRVREKLALIVVDNKTLYDKIISIF